MPAGSVVITEATYQHFQSHPQVRSKLFLLAQRMVREGHAVPGVTIEELPEIWKPTPGWPGYEVSSIGRVRRACAGPNTRFGKVLTPKIERNGYLRVGLCRGGRQHLASVHRLVCAAFHGPAPADGMDAAHRNGVRADNRESNLRWATKVENQNDKRAHGTLANGERIAGSKLTEDQVREIRRLYAAGMSTPAIAPLFNINKSNAVQIVRRKTWRHVQ